MENYEILFVDDDKVILNMVETYLTREGYQVRVADSGIKALDLLKNKNFDIVFTDFKMPELDGLELLSTIKEYRPETEVVIITGHGTMESAIQAMKIGSYDYLQKPFKLDILTLIIDRIIEEKKLKREKALLKTRVKERHKYENLVGISLKMQEIYEIIDRMRENSPNVLIQGESGTGKELAAHVIHKTSDRMDKLLIPVKCQSFVKDVPETQIREKFNELLESSHGGTLLLDEISAVSSSAQSKFLKALRKKQGSRDKGSQSTIDVRVIATTNRDWKKSVEHGHLTKDFIRYINAISINMPPLRDRKEDICLLIDHFLHKSNLRSHKKILNVSQKAMDLLLCYHWPGNVIQLENVIERAYALGVEMTIDVADLPDEIRTFGEIQKLA
jgi:DNA-binding NtrC family response regulator